MRTTVLTVTHKYKTILDEGVIEREIGNTLVSEGLKMSQDHITSYFCVDY